MKLKRIENEKMTKGDPAVSITKNGVFRFNKKATTELIQKKEKISFFQDEENKDSWYFSFVKDGDVTLRVYKENALGNSASLAKKIKASNNYKDDVTVYALIGNIIKDEESEFEVYPLLIKKAEKTIG